MSAAEQMYYDQQRELARFANARRVAADASLLNRPGSTDGANRQALVDAQAARNPGLPLVGPVNGDGRDPDMYYTRQSRRPEAYYAYPTGAGIESMQQDEPLHTHQAGEDAEAEAEAEAEEVYGTPEASQDLADEHASAALYRPRYGT